MSTPISPSSLKNKALRWIVLLFLLGWMAMYPIYTNYYKGLGIEQYERHQGFMAHQSMFFNPWQYRVFCPFLIEGAYQVFDHTIFKAVDFSRIKFAPPQNSGEKNIVTQKLIEQSGNGEFFKYNLIFVLFRFVLHMVIFWLAFRFFGHFTTNKRLAFLGLVVASIFMGNAVADSDLSFNTYVDVILYLGIGIVMVESLSYWWVVLITVIGALNRETSLLIPAVFFISKINFNLWPNVPKMIFADRKALAVTFLSLVAFAGIFLSIRCYYGYQPATVWRVPAGWQMVRLNLLSSVSLKTYMEMFGVFGIFPICCLLVFKQMSPYLRLFFVIIVPIWFGIHLVSVVSYQSRLFLVPSLLIFIPAVLEFIESYYKNESGFTKAET